MAYPDEIVVELTKRFGLSETHQLQLRETLMADSIRTVIESGKFDPVNIIIRLEMNDVLCYISVLSPIATQQLIDNPVLLNNLDNWLKWNRIKYEIEQLNHVRRNEVATRRRIANEILKRIEEPTMLAYIRSNVPLLQEYLDISVELRQHANARIEPIDTAATEYFTALFIRERKKITNIDFWYKGGGVHLGQIMKITYKDSKEIPREIVYYIKTHQHGSLTASRSGSIANIDFKELFVYKILEYIGYGPKAHYFFNPLSPGGFFIATQDAKFTKIPGKDKKFKVFDRIVEAYETTHTDAEHDSARRNIIALDMISRILRISDTITNPGNYGRVTVGGERTKWKLLDFRILSEPDISYLRGEIFEDFCVGNGSFNYDAKTFFKDIFRDPATEKRKFEMAHNVTMELNIGKPCQSRDGRKLPLLDAMARAHEKIRIYINTHSDSLRLDLSAILTDFDSYYKAIQANFTILAKGIENRYAMFATNVEEKKIENPFAKILKMSV